VAEWRTQLEISRAMQAMPVTSRTRLTSWMAVPASMGRRPAIVGTSQRAVNGAMSDPGPPWWESAIWRYATLSGIRLECTWPAAVV
jgi:hypothetical protein